MKSEKVGEEKAPGKDKKRQSCIVVSGRDIRGERSEMEKNGTEFLERGNGGC